MATTSSSVSGSNRKVLQSSVRFFIQEWRLAE